MLCWFNLHRNFTCTITSENVLRLDFLVEHRLLYQDNSTITLNMKNGRLSNNVTCMRDKSGERGLVTVECPAWDFEREEILLNTYDLKLVENRKVGSAHAQNGSSSIDEITIFEERFYEPTNTGCNCNNFYKIRNLNSTSSYDKITLTWEQAPWLLFEPLTVKYTDEKGSVDVTMDVNGYKSCGKTCETTFEELTHCTLYRVCIQFRLSGKSRECRMQRTRCFENPGIPKNCWREEPPNYILPAKNLLLLKIFRDVFHLHIHIIFYKQL